MQRNNNIERKFLSPKFLAFQATELQIFGYVIGNIAL